MDFLSFDLFLAIEEKCHLATAKTGCINDNPFRQNDIDLIYFLGRLMTHSEFKFVFYIHFCVPQMKYNTNDELQPVPVFCVSISRYKFHRQQHFGVFVVFILLKQLKSFLDFL